MAMHDARPAVLLLAHGSRVKEANEGMLQVVADLRETGRYSLVESAYLEISTPDIPGGLELCRVAGATRIIIIPYFLHLGRHVRDDLPGIIAEWMQRHPQVSVTLGPHLGYSPKLSELVEERIEEALDTPFRQARLA